MPNTSNPWHDPRTLIAIGGLTVGILGFLFGLLRDKWSRRESRLDALGKILQPCVRAAQDLMRANNARKKAEQLKHSFPRPKDAVLHGVESPPRFPKQTDEVVHHVNSLIDDYERHNKSSETNFRDAESELATRHFRFPTPITKRLKELHETLGELGRLVNAGFFDKADLQIAKFRDQYNAISDVAKGWRLADPLEGILRHFRREESPDEQRSEFELTQDEMNGVLELIHKRATTQAQNTFAVHPPQKMIDDPTLVESDDVIHELKDSVFTVVFQDGTTKMLSLPELMAFNFNLIVLAHETEQLNKMVAAARPTVPTEFNVSFQFSMQQIMTPETVKVLLSKFTFSDTPSDG